MNIKKNKSLNIYFFLNLRETMWLKIASMLHEKMSVLQTSTWTQINLYEGHSENFEIQLGF